MIGAILHPRHLARSTRQILETFRTHRELLYEQTRRELIDQHAGQIFGSWWSILHPLFIMIIYVFVFSFVFQNRVGGTRELPLDYTTYLLCGLAPWLALVQSLAKTATSLTANANLIKQVVFPIELLPAKAALSTMVPLVVMFGVYFGYTCIFQQNFMWTQLLLPLLFVIYAMWAIGIGLLLASANVFIRDSKELVQVFSVAGVFLMPIIYLPNWVPPLFKPLLYVNPFSYLIWCFQDALYFGRIDHPWSWIIVIFGGITIFSLGARVFRGLKPYFGDAL